MYLKIAWHLKTYIDTNSSIDFEKLHEIKNQRLFRVNKTSVFLKGAVGSADLKTSKIFFTVFELS